MQTDNINMDIISIQRIVDNYIATMQPDYTEKEKSYGKCYEASENFSAFLMQQNIPFDCLIGVGLRKPMVNPALLAKDKNSKRCRAYFAHIVVLIEDFVIDMTYRQFGDNYNNGYVMEKGKFLKLWKNVEKRRK